LAQGCIKFEISHCDGMRAIFVVASATVACAAPNECPADATSTTLCATNHTCCADSYSHTKYGCCDMPNAVCCHGGRCCPEGSTCTASGCSPSKPVFPCGPVQGQNCTSNYVCHPGPRTWSTDASNGTLLIMGDSVSIGYTPHLAKRISQMTGSYGAVAHTPDAGDGGARSTSAAIQCMEYYLSKADGTLLPLTSKDTIAFNYGLHDYNYGLDGVQQYEEELAWVVGRLEQTPATLVWISTSPAHNVDPKFSHGDDTNTVIEMLNQKATTLMNNHGIPVIDVYTAIMDECGPVPFEDSGDHACSLCAPKCNGLQVHYSSAGYEFISEIIASAIQNLTTFEGSVTV